jgi:hypothetical protein
VCDSRHVDLRVRARLYQVASFVVGFILVMTAFHFICPNSAAFLVTVLTPVGIISTVLFAMYGDFLREWFFPVRLDIELLREDERNSEIDTTEEEGHFHQKYSHHLKVVNLSKNKKVENCRIWMKRLMVMYPNTAGKPHDNFVMAAPRLMNWAPAEIDSDKRTFITYQIFDLGESNEKGFKITIDKRQEHAIKVLKEKKEKFYNGATIVCSFYATADNYHEEREFVFQIVAGNLKKFSEITSLPSWPAPAESAYAVFQDE